MSPCSALMPLLLCLRGAVFAEWRELPGEFIWITVPAQEGKGRKSSPVRPLEQTALAETPATMSTPARHQPAAVARGEGIIVRIGFCGWGLNSNKDSMH